MCAVIVSEGVFRYNYLAGRFILHTFGKVGMYAGEGCRNH